MPHNVITSRLINRKYIIELNKYKEVELNVFGLFVLTGFNQKKVKVHKLSSSATTYTTRKKNIFICKFYHFI
jgi:hypothetical protein